MNSRLIAAVIAALIVLPVGANALPGTAQLGQSCRAYGLQAGVQVTVDCPDALQTVDALLIHVTGVDCPVFSRGACDETLAQARKDAIAAVAPHVCGDNPAFTVNCDDTRSDVESTRRLARKLAGIPLRRFHRIYCAGADPTGTVPTWCD